MHILHIALGGCLKAPPVRFGATEDTGGHIAYLLGAAAAQGRMPAVSRIDLVTRAFEGQDPAHAEAVERVDDVTRIRRIAGGGRGYLDKEALEAALPDLTEAFLRLVGRVPRPDVIHAHFADAAELALAARALWDVPVVYTPHSLGADKAHCTGSDPALARRIARERRAIAEADAVIVSSRDEAERQLEAYGVEVAGRTHRLNPGVWLPDHPGTADADALVAPFLRDPDRPAILAIARPVAKKNLRALLDAYATTPGLSDCANLVILAGQRDGPDTGGPEQRATVRALLDGIDRHDLWGRVALPRRHEARHVPQLYRWAAARGGVFANPALHEPFGLTLLEAAHHGLPVVATTRGGPADIVAEIGHGASVDPLDGPALGRALLEAVSDGSLREARVAAARANLPKYSWGAYAARSVALYADIASPRARPAAPALLPARLLVSDIDGTLTGSREGAARFRAWVEDAAQPWAVATGRSLPEARRVLAAWDLPEPSAWITAVGTELHMPDAEGRLSLEPAYAAAISEGWDRARVVSILLAADATFQADVEQRRWKLGLFGDRVEFVRIRAALKAAGAAATVIHSHEDLIDVLAPRADKAAAMAHLAGLWGLSAADCVACGDSGNDAAMLRAAGTAVLVGNVLSELSLPARPGLIRARAHHADGVLEGLRRAGLAAPARRRATR